MCNCKERWGTTSSALGGCYCPEDLLKFKVAVQTFSEWYSNFWRSEKLSIVNEFNSYLAEWAERYSGQGEYVAFRFAGDWTSKTGNLGEVEENLSDFSFFIDSPIFKISEVLDYIDRN